MITAPQISKALIDYLESTFSPVPTTATIAFDTHPHEIAALVHYQAGAQSIIRHLKAVYEYQQTQDPLNVYQDTKDT